MTTPELKKIVASVCTIAMEVGSLIRNSSSSYSKDSIITKGLHDLVSEVDLASEKILVERLSELLPEAGIMAEEGSGKSDHERYVWIIDPLDGTTNFLHSLPPYSVSIGLTDNGVPVAGVVYEIGKDELFYAWQGGGAWLNGRRIGVTATSDPQDTLAATGFPFRDFSRMDGFLKCLEHFFRNTRGVRRMGSASVDLAYVAAGRFDFYFEYALKPWDIAAGMVIVSEAGGKATNFNGEENDISGIDIIASNGVMHKYVTEIVSKFISR